MINQNKEANRLKWPFMKCEIFSVGELKYKTAVNEEEEKHELF